VNGRACLAHPGHDPAVPIHWHRIRPLARGGWRSHGVRLCANSHGIVHDLLDLIEDTAATARFASVHEVIRSLPEHTWASFPGAERVIAYAGWKAYGLGFLNGRYRAHYRFWRTDGTPKEPDVPVFDDLVHAARWSKRWRREMERL
jgi:hypothetical protein